MGMDQGNAVAYTVFSLGDAQLHQLHTPQGKLFVMSEVALQLFHETPGSFSKELRAGRYGKVFSQSREVLRAISSLGLPPENAATPGATLLLPETVEALLTDHRRPELVQAFRLALLKLASQEAARLMAGGDYAAALPLALDAVKQGQTLFKPAPALQLFPLYLLAAQANLGLKRAKQCEDFLGLASWLAVKEPHGTSNMMRSQLSRLFGQLYALQGRQAEAMTAFAEDVYYCALEYGPQDVRTSLGYYNLSKVFQAQGEADRSDACNDQVVSIWSAALLEGAGAERPLGRSQLLEVADMLADVASQRAQRLGAAHVTVGEALFALGLVMGHVGEIGRAREHLVAALRAFGGDEQRSAMTQRAIDRLVHAQAALAM